MSNPIAYAELHTKNATTAKAFYGELFDWKLTDHQMPGGLYTEISAGEGIPSGLLQADELAGSRWLPYVTVGDLVAATEKAKRLGAKAVKENQEVPGMGRYSLLTDPTGATFGLWQKNPKPAGL